MILYVNITLPSTLAAQRVIIILNESVDEINSSYSVLNPFYIELIPYFQVSGLVVFYKQAQSTLLVIVFCAGGSQLQFLANLFDGRSVHAVNLPWNLYDIAVCIFCNLSVQTIGNRSFIGFVLYRFIVCLNLGTGYALIEVTC